MRVVRNGDVGDWRLSDADFAETFRLPSQAQGDRHDALAERNPLTRDTRISFDEERHIYTVDGVTVQRSVTGFVHAYAPEFDPHDAIQMMKAGRNWETKRLEFLKENGEEKTPDEIAHDWSRNGEVQRKRGTLLHFHAEQYLNGGYDIELPHSP